MTAAQESASQSSREKSTRETYPSSDFVETTEISRDTETDTPTERCGWRRFQGKEKAQGFAFAATGQGSIFMSNVFLSTAFVYLANDEVGCIDEETDEIVEECNERVYGFSPDSLVTNIAAIASLAAAFLLPLIGAIIDYTEYRRLVGRISAMLIFLIQIVQIAIGPKTWFPMAILQAILLAVFEFHYSIATSYLPDLARYDVDHDTLNIFNRIFYWLQYGGQIVYLIIVTGISLALDFSTIETARLGQIVGSLWLMFTFPGAWIRFPEMSKRHELPEGHSNLLAEGFKQNFRTAKTIYHNSSVLRWFYLAVVVGEAGSSALLPVAVNLLANNLQYTATEVGISFLLALTCAVPGVMLNFYICRRHNPVISATIAQAGASIATVAAIFVLTSEDTSSWGRLFSALWGLFLGWWYSSENLMFSILVPAGQESELSGFFVYCTIILTWAPPLIYSAIVENGGDAELGLISLAAFQLLAVLCLQMIPSWDEALLSAKVPLILSCGESNTPEQGDDNGAPETNTGEATSEKTSPR